jgi:hypothetical protein
MACYVGHGHDGLVVCGTCGTIKGPITDEWRSTCQLCSCATAKQRQAQRKFGRDFACWVELCYCCGLHTVGSGSRWSPFHCQEYCRQQVRAFNNLVGYCLIPVGRHSLMNQVALQPEERSQAQIEAFVGELKSVFARIDEHRKWAQATVLGHLAYLGFKLGADVPLEGYLERARLLELTSEYVFGDLVRSLVGQETGLQLLELLEGSR